MTGPGHLSRVSTYVHEGCPAAFSTNAPRVEVSAGRLACSACGAWWDSLNVGEPPDGSTASDPGPRTARTPR